MNRMASLVQGDGRDDGDLVLRSLACLATWEFSAEVGVIDLDLSPQQVGLLPLSHCPQDLVVQQPGRVVFHAQVAAELQRGDPGFGLADQVEGQEPSCERQLGGLHDRACREGGLMAAGTALIALKPPAMDKPMLVALATRTAEPIGPAGLLQSSLTLLLGAVEPLELRQGETFLEMDGTARHDPFNTCVPIYAPSRPCAEQARY